MTITPREATIRLAQTSANKSHEKQAKLKSGHFIYQN